MFTGRTGIHLRRAAKLALNHRGERPAMLRTFQFTLLGHLTPLVAVECDGMILLVSTADDVLGRETYEAKWFDLDFMDAVMELLRSEHGDVVKGRTFVDVGANIGTSAVAAVLRYSAARVVAMEPEQSNVRLLRANLALNGLSDDVDIHQVALSDAAGVARLTLCRDNWGDHRLSAMSAASSVPGSASVEVRTVRLQDLAIDDPGLVWMDVQGHEGHVLAGAGTMIDGVPIVTEFWPSLLQSAGGLEAMIQVMQRRRVIDVRQSMDTGAPVYVDAPDFESMIRRLGRLSTDLLLLP